MRFMPWLICLMLIIAGFFFAAFSEDRYRGQGTQWGYALTGLTCILLGTGFAFLIWNRETAGTGAGPAKGGPGHPLE